MRANRSLPPAHPIRIFVTAILASILTLALHATAVLAGPPTLPWLYADPNPVIVLPLQQSTGTTTLGWNLGTPQVRAADLWILPPDGTSSFVGTLASNGSAQSPPLTVGQSYTWKLFAVGTSDAAHLYSTVTVTVTHTALHSCSLEQCIQNLTVTPHGTFADFSFTTSLPALAMVQVSTQAPNKLASGDYSYIGIGNTLLLSPVGTQHNAQPLELELNTMYHYLITVGSPQSPTTWAQWTGTFKTLRRQVTVTFKDIHVIDDSDDLSDGDFTFWFNVNGAWDDNHLYPSSGEMTIGTGETVHPNYSKAILNPPSSMGIAAYGVDDDCDPPFDQCVEGKAPCDAAVAIVCDHGSDSEKDWATASGTIYTVTSGPNEVQTHTFSIVTGDWNVQFSASGTFKVDYVL
jgi:hypothetical protein